MLRKKILIHNARFLVSKQINKHKSTFETIDKSVQISNIVHISALCTMINPVEFVLFSIFKQSSNELTGF